MALDGDENVSLMLELRNKDGTWPRDNINMAGGGAGAGADGAGWKGEGTGEEKDDDDSWLDA